MNGDFIIDEDSKTHRVKYELMPFQDDYFVLPEGSYEIVFENTVSIGEDEAGFAIVRSTLNRNGLFITSGNYDSGYTGAMAAALHVSGGLAKIKRGTRVAQFLLFKAEALSQYDGSYGLNADGTPKTDEARYHN